MSENSRIGWQTSLVLDILRLSAALLVFVSHAYESWFTPFVLDNVDLGHFAVIIFFVLSGFLISYTTINNNRGLKQYTQARLSRLYSILIPALGITIFCQLLLNPVNPGIATLYSPPHLGLKYILGGLFSTELWLNSSAPPINGPLWSLSYEFWYYVIFGCWFYFRRSWKVIFLVLAFLIPGPAILLLMPIWLMGYFAYRIPAVKLSNPIRWLIFFVCFAIAFVLSNALTNVPYALGFKPFYYANQFVGDITAGIFVGIALWSIKGLSTVRPSPSIFNQVKKISDITFPLYLMHFPVLVIMRALLLKTSFDTATNCIISGIITLVIVSVIGLFFEGKRKWWYNLFGNWLNVVRIVRPATPPGKKL